MTRALLRAAIVGTGGVAVLHARAVAASGLGKVVAVTDHDPARAAAFAAAHAPSARVHDTFDALLAAESVDVVHVCTPPGPHAAQTAAAVAAGAHVVCEKPPALSLDELDAMTQVATAGAKQLAVVFQQRTGTAAAHVRALLASGALGRALVARCDTLWFRDADYFAVPWRGRWATEGGGTTLSHGIHQLDLLAFLLGDWASVRADLWRTDRAVETEDVSTATVRFASGAVAQVLTSVVSPRQTSSIRIDAEHATIEVDHLYGHGHEHWRITPAPHVDEATSAQWALPAVEVPSSHDDLVAQVYAALVAGEPLPAVAADPARSLELVTAIYASADAGVEVTRDAVRQTPQRAGLESRVRDARAAAGG